MFPNFEDVFVEKYISVQYCDPVADVLSLFRIFNKLKFVSVIAAIVKAIISQNTCSGVKLLSSILISYLKWE